VTAPAENGSTLNAALGYAERGWAVLPIRAGSKVPLTAHGVKEASCEAVAIREWWSRWPDACVAIACGSKSSGLVVLDCDAAEFVWALENACGPLPETFTVATGRGSHRYFVTREPIRTHRIAPHLEVRGEGAYVLAPPSLHPSGARYRVINDAEPAPLPDALRQLLCALPAQSVAKSTHAAAKISEGMRNSRLTSLAGSMRRKGMTPAAIGAALLEENNARCQPPLPESEVRRIADSVGRYEPEDNSADAEAPTVRESAATKLIELAQSNAELFHFGEDCFATIEVTGHQETYPVRSRGFRSWLGKKFFEQQKCGASGEALTSAITTLEGFARFQGGERAVYVRLAEYEDKVFLDLGDQQWRAIEISKEGWGIVESCDCPSRFRRPHGMLALPTPERGSTITGLRSFLNVSSDDDFFLIAGWLLATLHPRGPYPILILHGEQGSAKSTASRILRSLVDPNIAPVRSEPREPRDLMIAATNGLVCAFDNISHLENWLSDSICRLSTGGGFSTRLLYSDDEEKIFAAKRPVILNGIEELATRGDLLDRSIVVYLPRIPGEQRLGEEEFMHRFNSARPCLFGALLDAVSAALRNSNSVRLEKPPRMIDFCVWIVAAESVLGWKCGAFLDAYRANRQRADELPLETPFAEALRKLHLPWEGTATRLLATLESLTDERVRRSRGWPTK
jgi:hypothetical protein